MTSLASQFTTVITNGVRYEHPLMPAFLLGTNQQQHRSLLQPKSEAQSNCPVQQQESHQDE